MQVKEILRVKGNRLVSIEPTDRAADAVATMAEKLRTGEVEPRQVLFEEDGAFRVGTILAEAGASFQVIVPSFAEHLVPVVAAIQPVGLASAIEDIGPAVPIQVVHPGSPFEPAIGFSRAVRVGDRVLVSGTAPIWPDGSCDPDPRLQARRCLDIVVAALAEAGARADDVVRTRMFVTDAAHADAVGRAHGEVFGEVRPAATMVVVAGLLDPRWKVELEAEAIVA